MPTAPKSLRLTPPPEQVRKIADLWRGSSSERGYTARWIDYAERLCRERIFCELCLERGVETSIVRGGESVPGQRRKMVSVVDHIIPVDGPDDVLFWEPYNHWCLCVECDRWKSLTFDGSAGHRKRMASDRTVDGVAKRRAEIVGEYARRVPYRGSASKR